MKRQKIVHIVVAQSDWRRSTAFVRAPGAQRLQKTAPSHRRLHCPRLDIVLGRWGSRVQPVDQKFSCAIRPTNKSFRCGVKRRV